MKPSLITALAVMLPTCALAAPGTRTPPAAPVEGVVVKVDGDEVVIDIGRAAGLPAGEPVHLFRRMVVQHPISGATIEDRFPIGAVTPAQVGELLSIVRDVGGLERPPVPGDYAVFRPPPPPPPPVAATPAPGRVVEADTAALDAIHAQSLPRRIELRRLRRRVPAEPEWPGGGARARRAARDPDPGAEPDTAALEATRIEYSYVFFGASLVEPRAMPYRHDQFG